MTKKPSFFFLLSSLFLILAGVWGCKKEAADTAFGRIQGRWKLIQFGVDNNGDHAIESYELELLPSTTVTVYDFKGDSTGIESSVVNGDSNLNINFHWQLNGDSLWIATSLHDTTTYYVQLLNSSNLVLFANLPISNGSGSSTILTENYFNKD